MYADLRESAFSEGRSELLRRGTVLPVVLAALVIFEPVLVLLAVGHGGAFEGGGLLL